MGWPVPALRDYLHLQARRAGAQSTKFTASCGAAWDDCFSKRASTVILRQCLVNDGSRTRRAHRRVERVLLSGVELFVSDTLAILAAGQGCGAG